jgi:NDP-sugar pyrophosphorylase family protein
MQELIEKDGDVYGLLLPSRFSLTHSEDLLQLNLHFLEKQKTRNTVGFDNLGNNTSLISPVIIEEAVTIGDNCKIGPNVFIERGAVVGDGVWLENCVVLRDQNIPAQTRLKDKIIFE